MSIRRPHRKSRNGCVECKRRRVKCNEQMPCHNCLKYQSDCIYHTDLGLQNRSSSRPKASPSQADPFASVSVIGAVESVAGASQRNPTRGEDFDARDLELMHHFSTVVAKTISCRVDMQDAWAVAIPKMAYTCDYLMHGLLAISALHMDLSSNGMGSDYTDLLTYHLHKSLAQFREKLAGISFENCLPLFANSSLMVVHVCAQFAKEKNARPDQVDSPSHMGKLMDIFNMCRGVQTVLAPYSEEIQQSSLSPLLNEYFDLATDISSSQSTNIPEYQHLHDLANLITGHNLESHEQNEYLDALEKLKAAFEFVHVAAKPLECGVAFVWPIILQRDSIRLFSQLSPPSLVLIAHYCVILHHLDDYWFLHGWHKALLAEITEALPLGLRTWVAWPRKVCGLAK